MTAAVYDCDEWRGLWAAVSGGDRVAVYAATDWLLEHEAESAVAAECGAAARLGVYDVWRLLGGSGSGIGSGRGRGIGRGRGSGSGIGRGRGIGRGSGIGSGSGRGSGRVRGIGSGTIYPGGQMRVGRCYLVHGGDWHTFVGRVREQLGPLTYELEGVSKVAETNNGDVWHELAAGDERLRRACDYRHHTTPVVVPLGIAAIEWVGKLPQEAGY
jgi:hypothetical protein